MTTLERKVERLARVVLLGMFFLEIVDVSGFLRRKLESISRHHWIRLPISGRFE